VITTKSRQAQSIRRIRYLIKVREL
jgi:hypothetical protein